MVVSGVGKVWLPEAWPSVRCGYSGLGSSRHNSTFSNSRGNSVGFGVAHLHAERIQLDVAVDWIVEELRRSKPNTRDVHDTGVSTREKLEICTTDSRACLELTRGAVARIPTGCCGMIISSACA
jgi:hypothetical protein